MNRHGTRVLAIFIALSGILTFFFAFVTTDPPVAGKSRWSPFQIVVGAHDGTLPSPMCERCGEPTIRALLGLPLFVSTEYGLLLFALVALCIHLPSRVVFSVALVGGYTSLRSMFSYYLNSSFRETFYGFAARGGRVHYREFMAIHVAVMIALFLVSLELVEEESYPGQSEGDPFV